MELKVFNKEGKETGRKVKLNDEVFNIDPNDHAIYLEVKRYMAASRQGTHKTKERSDVVGSTRKIKRQKGTGTARAGMISNPIFRGGGRVFGPRPRSYDLKLNKKVRHLARLSALSYKARNKQILVLEDFSLETPKTREVAQVIHNLEIAEKKSLIVIPERNKTLYLSSRNLQRVDVVMASQLTTYDITHASKLILFEGTVDFLNKNFS
ncbi:MAG: 50S ribosomal protein L4 [Chlorobi bacterium]|nr:50S ribosomal protein L4 [Chlorobiota bacterium]